MKYITPKNIRELFGGPYIPDNRIVWVHHNDMVLKMKVIDMRVYTDRDIWIVLGKDESNEEIHVQYPENKFMLTNPKIECCKMMILIASKLKYKFKKIRKRKGIMTFFIGARKKNLMLGSSNVLVRVKIAQYI